MTSYETNKFFKYHKGDEVVEKGTLVSLEKVLVEKSLAVRVLVMVLRVYQVCLSPFLVNSCRFYPSCSHYALEAIQNRGVLAGVMLTFKRLSKCHPWHPGGVDLVDVEANSADRMVN